MVRTCCVPGCNVRSHDRQGNKLENGLSFYCFPTWKQREGDHVSNVTKRRRQAWIAAVRRDKLHYSDQIPKYLLVCSRHFHSGKPSYEMHETHPDWVPTLHMGHSEVPASKSERRLPQKRQRGAARDLQDGATEYEVEVTVGDEELDTTEDQEAKRQKVECKFCEASSKEINRLLEENSKLRSELYKSQLNEDFVKDDTEKVRYYTGLPSFAVLLNLFNSVQCFLPATKKLSPFQVLLLTLMRLRLDLPALHLCHLVSVSHKVLTSAFADTIDILHARFGHLVQWPKRHNLQATMPPQFVETFGKRIAILVDCFEIRTERPSSLKACARTCHYKDTHTMKYLIGFTPQGTVSFVSKGWGGRASDKDIAEKCGLLKKLSPGDVVLADRGFDIKDAVGMMCAEVKSSSSAQRYCRLEAKDAEGARATAHLRMHVRRVIGSMRDKYKMLHATIPIRLLLPFEEEEMTLLDKIVNVCCILVNMRPSVVAKPEENETNCGQDKFNWCYVLD